MSRDLSFDRAIAFAQDLIRIPGGPGGEEDVARRVESELRELGFADVRSDEVGNVIGRAPGRGDGPVVMVNSHMDVVDAGDPEGWEHPPFDGVIADGHLHGRGAMDIKGPLALQTYAAAGFLDDPMEGDVVVAHTVLEERGGWGMDHLLRSGAVRPDVVVNGEATNGDVCIGHRGRAEVVIELQGVAGHASAPDRAANPLFAVGPVTEALRGFAEGLGSDPILGSASLAPTDVDVRPKSRNVIPDRVRIIVDWRVLPDRTADAAVAALRSHLRDRASLPDGIGLEVRFARERQTTFTGRSSDRRLFTPGFLLDPDHPVARAAREAVGDATGTEPTLRPWTFATDGGYSCGVSGIPTVGYAPGEERYAHTNRERLGLDAARRAYAAYPGLLRATARAVS